MLEAIAKNLWILLTLVIPGLFTYGAWRILLILEPSKRLNIDALNQVDSSAIVSTSIIIAVALLQQAIAIAIESALALLAKSRQKKWPNIYSLFCERFELAAAGTLDESATRIIGNFFLSINMSIGLVLLLFYFLFYESMCVNRWIPLSVSVLLIATLITTVFRMLNAKWVIMECKKTNSNKILQSTAESGT
ncbi:MAG: hypothetical protein GY847_28460 [Proteobacteria bacterium]|nr:hypothetical protein [Pseudomonadota bacterium]